MIPTREEWRAACRDPSPEAAKNATVFMENTIVLTDAEGMELNQRGEPQRACR
jgi:hypothetical protein